MSANFSKHVVRAVLGFVALLAHRDRERLLDRSVAHDRHRLRRVVDGGDQLLGNGETRLGARGVDVDDRPGRPEVLGPPAQLGVVDPVEPAGDRRNRRDVNRVLSHLPVGDRPLEVDVDRLGRTRDGPVGRVERRRHERRLPGERCRVLPGRGALGDGRRLARYHGQRVDRRRRRRERIRRRRRQRIRRRRWRGEGERVRGRRRGQRRQRIDRRRWWRERVDGRRNRCRRGLRERRWRAQSQPSDDRSCHESGDQPASVSLPHTFTSSSATQPSVAQAQGSSTPTNVPAGLG